MAVKTGNGGHGMEKYDPDTGRYIGDESEISNELKSVMNLSDEDIYDDNLKSKYNLSNEDIKRNIQIDKAKAEIKKNQKLQKEEKNYDEEIEKTGDELYNYFQQIEPQITNNIVMLCEALGGRMYGLDQRIKSKNSIKAKLNRHLKKYGIPIEDNKRNFYDGIRYTVVFDTRNFTDSSNQVLKTLQQHGYELVYFKNRFFDSKGNPKNGYRDIVANFKNSDGVVFEVQLNTIKGICAKNGKEYTENGEFIDRRDGVQSSHFYYDEKRDMSDNDEKSVRGRYLDYMMEKIWNDIPIPENVDKIKGES